MGPGLLPSSSSSSAAPGAAPGGSAEPGTELAAAGELCPELGSCRAPCPSKRVGEMLGGVAAPVLAEGGFFLFG